MVNPFRPTCIFVFLFYILVVGCLGCEGNDSSSDGSGSEGQDSDLSPDENQEVASDIFSDISDPDHAGETDGDASNDPAQEEGPGMPVCTLVDSIVLTDGRVNQREHPESVWTGSEYLLGWKDGRHAGSFCTTCLTDIYWGTASRDGTGFNELRLTDGSCISEGVDIAWTGENLGMTWHEYCTTSTTPDMKFALVSKDGEVLVHPVTLMDDAASHAVVWTGTGFMIAFSDFFDAERTMIVDGSGTVVGEPVLVSGSEENGRAEYLLLSGSHVLMVWMKETGEPSVFEGYLTRLDLGGNPVEEPVLLTPDDGIRSRIMDSIIAEDELIVSWSDYDAGEYPRYFRRFDLYGGGLSEPIGPLPYAAYIAGWTGECVAFYSRDFDSETSYMIQRAGCMNLDGEIITEPALWEELNGAFGFSYVLGDDEMAVFDTWGSEYLFAVEIIMYRIACETW